MTSCNARRACGAMIVSGMLSLLGASMAAAQPLTTAFIYQGDLRTSGAPATGPHDLRFRLYDAAAGGAQVGSMLCSDNVSIANGRFTVSLDFGSQFAGAQRFLEIEVRADTGLDCGNAAGFVILGPRQALAGTPNALFALNATSATTAATATNATQFNGQGAAFYQNAGNLNAGTIPDARLSGTYTGNLTLSNVGNVFSGSFTGSGAGLTAINAANIASGTLADARLSNSVALLNAAQTFSAAKTFSAAPSFSAAGAPFSVNATGLVTNLNADRLDGLDSTAFLQGLPNPLTLSGASAAHIIRGENAPTSAGSAGLWGLSTSTSNATSGVYGESASTGGRGVLGVATNSFGSTFGVRGESASSSGRGVSGFASAASGATYGVYGESASTSGRGVLGLATAATGTNYGVFGQCASATGTGVRGQATAATGTNYGGWFESASPSGTGVHGLASSASGATFGVYGESASTSGRGVRGQATASSGATYGGWFESASPTGRGVFGVASNVSGEAYGVHGVSESSTGRGVYGVANATTGATYGVFGRSTSASGIGVFGWATGFIGPNCGVRGESGSTSGCGVHGVASSLTGTTFGVIGESATTDGRGVFGRTSAATGVNYGGRFESSSMSGRGVFGWASATSGTTFGVVGWTDSPSGWGVYAVGPLGATGTKSFRIDHPFDPLNKYLLHYASESPTPQNFYSGNVTTDAEGYAWVTLPDYFEEINANFKYQLTVIDDADSDGFVQAKVSREIKENRFQVRTSTAGVKVSWRVEADRNDLWVRANPPRDEVAKEGLERGTYQHPDLYGQPAEKGMNYDATRERPERVQPEPPAGFVTNPR